jgi:hypothetical protein
MRLPKTAHTSRPWRVHEFTGDFELEDVWKLPTPGGPDDLERLVELTASASDDSEYPAVFRALFALRWKLGKLFGWDEAGTGVGERVASLRERLPADLREGPSGPDMRAVPGRAELDGPPIFVSLYQTRDEWLTEYASETVHSLMHIGWVADDAGGGYHAQMAVLVKPNGWLGRAYMAAIKPFRYALIYPMLLRSIERQWQAGDGPRQVSVTDPIVTTRRYDYADAFELRLEEPDRCSPEEWVRAGVDATPAWIKWVAGAPDGLGSARVAASGVDVVVFEDSDPLMDTVMVGRNLEPERRVLTTVLRYRRPLHARAIWTVVGILHRRTARRVVAGGLREGDRSGDAVLERSLTRRPWRGPPVVYLFDGKNDLARTWTESRHPGSRELGEAGEEPPDPRGAC